MDFKFKKGISEFQIKQLVKYAQTDPEVIKFTSDPTRFKDIETAKKWLKNVTVYTLTNDYDLLGIIWFHVLPLPKREFTTIVNPSDYPITFAIRLYGQARGKGFSFDFMRRAFDDFGKQNVWIETSVDNFPTIHISQKFGFKQISQPDERGKIIMIFKNPP